MRKSRNHLHRTVYKERISCLFFIVRCIRNVFRVVIFYFSTGDGKAQDADTMEFAGKYGKRVSSLQIAYSCRGDGYFRK